MRFLFYYSFNLNISAADIVLPLYKSANHLQFLLPLFFRYLGLPFLALLV